MPSDADWLRREMGRELAKRRHAAGLSQTEFAALTGRYSTSSVSHAETGKDDVGRGFWEAADRALGTGEFFAASYEMIWDTRTQARTAVTVSDPHLRSDPAMKSERPELAFRAYRQRGWPVSGQGESMRLPTGKAADALEVGRMAAKMAAGEWEETNGAESIVRGLPRLPPYARSLAAIDAGNTWYFLVAPGSCPWHDARPGTRAGQPHIRWHSAGSSIPAPPSSATWAHLPAAGIHLAPPQAVLDLLGWAAARVSGPDTLTIRGSVTVAPAGKG
jgi:transcriptional regulator with XRE-family HTH domain